MLSLDPTWYNELSSAVGQLETIGRLAPQLRDALASALQIVDSVATIDRQREQVQAGLDAVLGELDRATAERDRVKAELSDLAAKRQAALQKALDAFADLK